MESLEPMDGSGVYGLVAGTTPPITLEWFDPDGKVDTADNIATPLSHVRSMPGAASTLTAQVSFKTDKLPAGSYEIEGTATGPGGFSATLKANAAVSGPWLVADVVANQALPDTIQYDDLVISWKVNRTHNGKVSDKSYGQTRNTSYITGAAAADAFETVLYLGCKNAAWKRPANPGDSQQQGETKNQEVVDAIWVEFSDRHVERVDGAQLKYWHTAARTPEGAFPYRSVEALLRAKDGDCYAWVDLFRTVVTAQGATESKAVEITSKYKNATVLVNHPNEQGKEGSLLIKNWSFDGQGDVPDTQGFTHVQGTFSSGERIEAQGNENSPSVFRNHRIVQYGSKFYDPSYGGEAHATQKDWEIASLAGFSRMVMRMVDGVLRDVNIAKQLNDDPDSETETVFTDVP